MHISGILVVAQPQQVSTCIAGLEALPGVEVHGGDPPSGRLVVVQESATLAAQQEGLRRIQALPEVVFAALVEHCIDQNTTEGQRG